MRILSRLIDWKWGGGLVCLYALCLLPAGCGGGAATTEEEEVSDDEEYVEDEPSSDGKAPRKTTRKKVKKKPKGPMIGDIPLDAFEDRPFVASAGGAAAPEMGVKPATGAAPAAVAEAPSTEESAAPAAGAGEWAAIVTGEVVTNETKKIRLRAKESLKNMGKFRADAKDLAADAAVLAALSSLTPSLADAPSWKPQAKFVRDLAADLGRAAKESSSGFEQAKEDFEKLESLLSGNNPAGLPDSKDDAKFPDICSRGPVMRRMERAFNWMSSNIKTEDNFKKEQETIAQESAVLAMLTKVIGAEGYDSADDEEYQKFVKSMLEANMGLIEATKQSNFASFEGALSKTKKACDECHADFRFGG